MAWRCVSVFYGVVLSSDTASRYPAIFVPVVGMSIELTSGPQVAANTAEYQQLLDLSKQAWTAAPSALVSTPKLPVSLVTVIYAMAHSTAWSAASLVFCAASLEARGPKLSTGQTRAVLYPALKSPDSATPLPCRNSA